MNDIPAALIELLERPITGRLRLTYRAQRIETFAELVQDRASELITHFDNSKRVSEIAKELYEVATAMVKR